MFPIQLEGHPAEEIVLEKSAVMLQIACLGQRESYFQIALPIDSLIDLPKFAF